MITRPKRLAAAVLSATALAAALPAGASAAADFAPGEVIVKFDGSAARTVDLPRDAGVRTTAAALRQNPAVDFAAPNYIATASALPNDPGTSPGIRGKPRGWVKRQWNFLPCGSLCRPSGSGLPHQSLGGIDVISAWHHAAASGHPGGSGVTVAVLDTGIAFRTLGNRFRRSPDFSRGEFTTGHDFIGRDPLALDDNGHGTHVAGTIAEATNNRLGLTGIAFGVELMPVRVLNRFGRGKADKIARGIRFAALHGADVINMSFNFGCNVPVPTVTQALRFAHRHGAVLVASAGNAGSEACVSAPATEPHVIGVGGTTEGACLGFYSLSGDKVDLVAPGGGGPLSGACAAAGTRPILQVTLRTGTTNVFGIPRDFVGTSMSAAHVSGVAALILAEHILGRSPDPDAVTTRLKETARDLGPPGVDPGYGAGLIDAGAATDPKLP
jgi:serine protease